MYPPEQNPEGDYYYEEGEYEYEDVDDGRRSGGFFLQTALAFFAGGCLMFLCLSFCGLLLATGWTLDLGAGLAASAPIPGSDIGLFFDDPAYSDERVVNEQNLQLVILEVNRNAALETMPAVEGREIIIVTIELLNLGEEKAIFNERDFMLLNGFEEVYAPALGAIAGSLGRGDLPPGEGLEGRLVFEVKQGESDLRMLWEPAPDAEPRYIYLE
jgi:hypothetical protein